MIHIRAHTRNGNAYLCTFFDKVGQGFITNDDISYGVKFAATALKYPSARGIPIDRIDTHSLQAGGACAMALQGYKPMEICKMGRWAPKSTSFLEYIHT